MRLLHWSGIWNWLHLKRLEMNTTDPPPATGGGRSDLKIVYCLSGSSMLFVTDEFNQLSVMTRIDGS